MKPHRLLSLHFALAVMFFAMLHAGTLQASAGGHKYRDLKAWSFLIIMAAEYSQRGLWGVNESCDSFISNLSVESAVTFMQEFDRELPGLLALDARYVACRPAATRAGTPAYTLVARQPGSTNALYTAVRFQHNLLGWIESLTFDRPLALPDGATYPAGAPVPIEPLMRTLALRRSMLPPGTPTLTIKRAVQKTSYANSDVAKAKVSSLLRGSVPTTLEGFNWVGHFYVTPLPLLTTAEFVHAIERMYDGTKRGKHPKYTHLFVYSNATEKTPPFGLFMATLRKGNLDFIYKFKVDNRNTNIFSVFEFNYIRSLMASNTPNRSLEFARFHVDVGCEVHTATNVPILMRISKAGITLSNVKPGKSN